MTENTEWIQAARTLEISMIVVDEAHCISMWGHDFIPSYRRIVNLVNLLPQNFPILATTATATKRVEADIAAQMGGNMSIIRGNLVRPNFEFYVIEVNSEDDKLLWIADNINKLSGSGLIYTGTRVNTEVYSRWLEFIGIESINYNAGLDADTRKNVEKGLKDNRWKCIVSTNALGLGIDKADIRFIIHTQIPQSPIHYYQEIGRAGRDGKPSKIILLYNSSLTGGVEADEILPRAFIEGGRPDKTKYLKVIDALKEEPMGEHQLMRHTNLKSTPLRVIKADLIEQGIAREVLYGKSKKLELIFIDPALNTEPFENLNKAKLDDLAAMVEYVHTKQPRMKYLCGYLGDSDQEEYCNCDNTGLDRFCVADNDLWCV